MKKGQIIEGYVQRVDFPNKGVVETPEGICIVKNVLPGQKVRCAVNKARNGRAEGRLLEIVEKSPIQTEEACPHFGICGGCTYLSIPYEEQLKIKEAQVKKLLDSVLKRGELCKPTQTEDVIEGIKPSPVCYGYRNKMEFSFGDEVKDGPLALGMHKRGSFYDVVSVTGCMIVDKDYRAVLETVLAYFSSLQEQGMPVGFYHRLRHTGYLRHLLVRKGSATGEILIALVTTSQYPQTAQESQAERELQQEQESQQGQESRTERGSQQEQESQQEQGLQAEQEPRTERGSQTAQNHEGRKKEISEEDLLNGLKEKLLALSLEGRIVGILHTVNDAVADVVQSDRTTVLYGRDYFYEELLGLRFKVSQFSFFQTNSRGAEVLYETAREYIGKYFAAKDGVQDSSENKKTECKKDAARGRIVYDLYSGTGTIAQLMAPVADKVIGVEIVEEAVEAARNNAKLNGLHNCEFIAGDVLKVLDEIEEKPDIIILDPPRDGVHPKALRKILDYGVEHILYISCKPTSLVRDLEAFLERGYTVERAAAVDQFPWTANVETVCLLSKLNVEHHIEVELNLDEMDLTAAESKASYEEIKAYVLEHSGLKVSNLYIAQIKRKCGIIERENYNKAKAEGVKVPKCPEEKERAIREALEYFKMM